MHGTSKKRCVRCGVVRPETSFHWNHGRDGSRRSTCNACAKEKQRRRLGCRKGARGRKRIHPRRSPEVTLQRELRRLLRRLLYARCAQQGVNTGTLCYRTRYRLDPVFRAKEIARRQRKTWTVHDDGSLTSKVLAGLFAASRQCPYCGLAMLSCQKTLDHVHPRSLGGEHSLKNVVVCCRSCNSRKGARLIAS